MSEIVKLYITYIEAKREVSRISILDAMKFLLQAWDRVIMETISKCFRCAKISLESQTDTKEDNNIPFKLLQLVYHSTTVDSFTDAVKTLSLAESATMDDEQMVLVSPLIIITKRAVENLDFLKDLHSLKYLQS